MKKLILILCFMFIACPLYAQCVGEIKDVLIDEIRGSIIVETQYTLNGEAVQLGRSRYTEESGTNEEIILKAKEDVAIHCENLIRRIEANQTFRQIESLKIQKALTEPVKEAIKKDLVGQKITKTEAIDTFKGKDIKVTYDEKNTVSDSVITPTP